MPTLLLALLAAALALASLAVGPSAIAIGDVVAALIGRGDTLHRLVVWELRVPRTLLALVIGFGLGVAGAALQGLLRNPLASPDLTGASNAAALGAVLVLVLGIFDALSFALPIAALFGALAAIVLLRLVTGPDPRPAVLILGGVAISAGAGAATAAALALAPNPFAVLEATFWLLGSLSDRSFVHVALAAPVIAIGCAAILSRRSDLAVLGLGEEAARSLGVDVTRATTILVAGAAAAVAGGVAVAGVIGFVGLVVPHLVRPLVGHDPARLVVPAGVAGAALTLAADILVRVLPTNGELRIGVVTALVGLPFFLALLIGMRRRADAGGGVA